MEGAELSVARSLDETDSPVTAVGGSLDHETGFDSEPESAAAASPLVGRTVVITGASAGIGAAAAKQVAALGARVIVVGRSPEKTAAVADSIGATAVIGDFARLGDVRRIADEILTLCPRIDVLANNAGALFPNRMITEDGNEMTFQVNHLAGFLLTGLLLPRLAATPGSRVLTTSSLINPIGHINLDDLDRSRRRYRQFGAYADSKLANILFARELARRVGDGAAGSTGAVAIGPTTMAFHPGLVNSSFGRDTWYFQKASSPSWNRIAALSPDRGAAPLVALAVRPDPHTVNGAYLHRFKPRERVLLSRQARDPLLARRLWERSAELVGLPG
ncbi:MAG: SDR family NAD(P)-dependent oxidoreductase [Frankia sp.]